MTHINQERLVEHFCQLVRIDSESKNEKQIAETLAEQLGELGFTVHKLPVPEHISNGFNVYARLDGKIAVSDMVKITEFVKHFLVS